MDKSGPPPPGFVPAAPPPPYTAQPQNVVIVGAPQFGSEPQRMTCPHCHADISTRVENAASTQTHAFALILCILGLWCCVPLPYCMDSCMAQKHFCPSCNAYLGTSRP
ncbi:lipopolysaccharide-induced tumor necrosis factor-alpha factor homolog [Xylocopa sonorina]|uniref:lipopolysaccharide-induced tumor necrosis factor-alpha factor homolog n=1 Tax=Xylocopa sonorina TaxID=1818115 RepID=UPI00403AE9C7